LIEHAPHCSNCVDSFRLRAVPHCSSCGFGQPLADGLCESCQRWEAGDRTVIADHALIERFVAAIVERAASDNPAGHRTRIEVPVICDCGGKTRQCAARYLDRLREFMLDNDRDGQAALLYVMSIANDELPVTIAA
jgi:hypothetical protein